MKYLLLVFFGTVFLSSCQSLYTTNSQGVATLKSNGFKLPLQIDGFQRKYITAFDALGLNTGTGYDFYSSNQQIALTVYVISSSSSLDPTTSEATSYFNTSLTEISKSYSNVTNLGIKSFSGHRNQGSLAEFKYDVVFSHSLQRVSSFLLVFKNDNCLVKYRITGPVSQRNSILSSLKFAVNHLTELN